MIASFPTALQMVAAKGGSSSPGRNVVPVNFTPAGAPYTPMHPALQRPRSEMGEYLSVNTLQSQENNAGNLDQNKEFCCTALAPASLSATASSSAPAAVTAAIDSEEQRNIVRLLMAQSQRAGLVLGELYYCIPAKWWTAWKVFAGYEEPSKGYSEGRNRSREDGDEGTLPPAALDTSGLVGSIDGEEIASMGLRSSGRGEFAASPDCDGYSPLRFPLVEGRDFELVPRYHITPDSWFHCMWSLLLLPALSLLHLPMPLPSPILVPLFPVGRCGVLCPTGTEEAQLCPGG